jgi:hypothetical protein
MVGMGEGCAGERGAAAAAGEGAAVEGDWAGASGLQGLAGTAAAGVGVLGWEAGWPGGRAEGQGGQVEE